MAKFTARPSAPRVRGLLVMLGLVALFAALAHALLTTQWTELPPPDPTSKAVATYLRLCEAKRLAGDRQYAQALRGFDELARTEAGTRYGCDAEIQAALAVAHLGQTDAALARIRRCLAECPHEDQVPAARICEAEIHGVGGDYDQATGMLEEMIREHADSRVSISGEALFALSRIHSRSGRHGVKRAVLVRIAEDFPGNEDTDRKLALRVMDRVTESARAQQQPLLAKLRAESGARWVEHLAPGLNVWRPGDGPYLVAGMLSVPAGSTLRIEAGTQVRFALDGGLQVEGTIEIEGSEAQPVRLATLDDDPDHEWWQGLVVPAGEKPPVVRLAYARIVGAETAIRAHSGDVSLANCLVERSIRAGVHASGDARVRLDGCELAEDQRIAVLVEARARPALTDCRVLRARFHGIVLRDAAESSFIRGCAIEACGGAGILVRGRSEPVIERCTVRANALAGIRSIDGASTAILASQIAENGGAGIQLEREWDGVVEGCRITANERGGLRLQAACRGRIVANQIDANREAGVVLGLGCTSSILTNRILANRGPGLLLQEQARPAALRDNQFLANAEVAIHNQSGAALDAAGNWWGSTDEQSIAALIDDDGRRGPVNVRPWLEQVPAEGVVGTTAEPPSTELR